MSANTARKWHVEACRGQSLQLESPLLCQAEGGARGGFRSECGCGSGEARSGMDLRSVQEFSRVAILSVDYR